MDITYTFDKNIQVDDVAKLYERCLTEVPRPTTDIKRLTHMFEKADIVCCAFDQNKMIGVCRCLSDFSYVTYISDLAVHPNYQRQGIGQTLIQNIQTKSPGCKLVLLSNTNANEFYPHIGFRHHPRAWILDS